MLISAVRVLIFLILVAAGIWGVFHLIEDQGRIFVQLAGQEYSYEPIDFAVLLLIGLAGIWLTLKIVGFILAVLRFIDGDETAISRYFNRSRERRGLEAMAHGMAALAAGDARAARNKAEKAELLLQRPELTRLLNAQAAELAGDDLRAETYYRALAEDPATSFIGVRGLLNRALEKGDSDRALKLAESAAKLRPKEPSVLDALYMLQSRKFDWAGARKTLDSQRRAGLLPKPEASRRDSMLALAQAEDAEELGEVDHARKLALEAAKLDPSNAEVVATAARHLVTVGSKRAAAKMIIEAWRRKPASALAAAYAAIEPDESAHDRRQRFAKLLNAFPSHPESQLLAAELALVTKDWAGARKAIGQVKEEEQPTARVCAIMAAIARGEGAPEGEVRGWLARALSAPRGDGAEGDLNHAAMLPLLIGGDDEPVEDAEELHDTDPADPTVAEPSLDEAGNPPRDPRERPKSAA